MQTVILQGFFTDEKYMRRVVPYMDPAYFEGVHCELFKLFVKYVAQYNKAPTYQSFQITLDESDAKLSEDGYRYATEILPNLFKQPDVDPDWLFENTEKWCQDRAVYNAVMESITIIDGKHQSLTKNALPDVLSKALAVTFDANIGHDYTENAEDRYRFYHEKEERIPFDLDMMNKITKGGLPNKSLNIVLAGCVHPDTKIKVRMRKKVDTA